MRRKRVRGPVGDRWHMAMYHTVQGDVDLALQSLYDPYSVSPAHQAEFGETYLRQVNAATEDAEKRGFLKAVQRLAGDPLIWLGLVLTIPFPGVGRRAVQRYMGRAVDYRRRIGVFDKLGGAMGVLRDEMGRRTEALDLLLGGAHEMAHHTHRMNEILHQGVKRFRKISGARPTTRDVYETLMHAERWHDPKQRMWREIPAWTGRARDIGPITFRLNPAQEELLRGWDEVRRYYFDHMIKPLSSSQKKTLRQQLQHQGAFVELPTEASVPFYAHRTLYADEKITRERVKSLMAEDRVEEAFIIGSHAGGGNRAVSREEYEAILLGDSIPAGARQRHYVLLPSVDHMRVVEDRLKPA